MYIVSFLQNGPLMICLFFVFGETSVREKGGNIHLSKENASKNNINMNEDIVLRVGMFKQ